MLFNSYTFIFAFLPITAAVFFLLGRSSRSWAIRWLILASLVFYAWWRPLNVLLIAPSILINFALARAMQQQQRANRTGAARTLLIIGMAFNIAFLGYFKYANFLVGSINDAFGTQYILSHIVLPLGISFITFQKIAFLVDVYSRRIENFTLQDYGLFVLFFPQLIAGPIVHYREMMPQFHRASCVAERENIAVGITLLMFGLFKKAYLADGLSPIVKTLFDQAGGTGQMSFVLSWMAAIGFTYQIYFDFSGYTDMALGIARIFGIRLPQNFNSPLRAASIIDFWLRWHMTLTRFLTAYLYNPLALRLTRRRMEKGLPGFGGRNSSLGGYLSLLVFPTMLTMVISGIWHGAGYLFILWGAMHGVFLCINHGWRVLARNLWPNKELYARIMRPIGHVVTFVSVVAAMVFFRATTLHAATNIANGMIGRQGLYLPQTMLHRMGSLGVRLQDLGVRASPPDWFPFNDMIFWLVALSAIVFFAPNTQQMLARFEPALGVKAGDVSKGNVLQRITWRPSLAWAIVVAIIAAVGVLQLSGPSEFLYWQF